jgi:hypothetical protein
LPASKKEDALQAERLDDRKMNSLLTMSWRLPPIGSVLTFLALRVEDRLARAERAGLEAAHRVDAAREVALEERQLVVDDTLRTSARTRPDRRSSRRTYRATVTCRSASSGASWRRP